MTRIFLEYYMARTVRNNHGSVLVFVTLMIVLLMIMVGMGLDTGWMTYVRSQGQPAVDAAALAATSGLIQGTTEVETRAAAFNTTNNYVGSSGNTIGPSNITYIKYDEGTRTITKVDAAVANGVRVALETTNPYGGSSPASAIVSPLFLTPLFNLFGANVSSTANISVTAVAYLKNRPGLPIALRQCTTTQNQYLIWSPTTIETACWTTYTIPPANDPFVEGLVEVTTGDRVPAVSKDQPIYLNNGTIATVLDAVEKTYGPFPPNKPCFTIPVVADAANCTKQSPITGFADICITAVQNGGQPTEMPDGQQSNHYIKADVSCNISLSDKPANSCSLPVLVRDKLSGM
jgi:Flp pilus assembly protein TadG